MRGRQQRRHVDTDASSDVVAFDAGVAHDQLWFARSGDDLVMSVIGQNRSLNGAGWYAADATMSAESDAGDGYAASGQGLQKLVQAMSAYSTGVGANHPAAGSRRRLAPALAANWQHA